MEAYTLANARLTWRNADEDLEVELLVQSQPQQPGGKQPPVARPLGRLVSWGLAGVDPDDRPSVSLDLYRNA